MSMFPERQEAYRHLLYTVLVHMRSGEWDVVWWNPASWRRCVSDWRKCKELANCFHNLAFFSVGNFENFDEERFWQDVERLGGRLGAREVNYYRKIFDEHVSGRAAQI